MWTGSEMIVWGGSYYPPGNDLNTGGQIQSSQRQLDTDHDGERALGPGVLTQRCGRAVK